MALLIRIFLKLLGNSQPAQSVFAIQVKRIKPSSVDIDKILLFAREDMKEYKIQLPTSMERVDKSITTPLHDHVVFVTGKCFSSSDHEQETADTLTKRSRRTLLPTFPGHVCIVTQDALVRECEVYGTMALTLQPFLESGLSSQSKASARVFAVSPFEVIT